MGNKNKQNKGENEKNKTLKRIKKIYGGETK